MRLGGWKTPWVVGLTGEVVRDMYHSGLIVLVHYAGESLEHQVVLYSELFL